VIRAASGPALYAQPGWAAELIHTLVADQLAALAPASAGARLLKASTILTGDGILSAPGFIAGPGNAGFVADGAPIPLRSAGQRMAATSAAVWRVAPQIPVQDGR
jgi:hypothetical protein